MTPLSGGADAPAIETDRLAKRYGSTVALAGMSMVVPRGQVFGFLGPNGAGKTTAVKLLLGLARPTGGTGRLREGKSLAAPRAFDLDVHRGDHRNYLLDSGRLIWHMVGRAVSAQTRPGL